MSNTPADAVGEYRRGVAGSSAHHLEPVYDALVARVDGLDINGQPLSNPNLTSKAEIDALVEDEFALYKSIDDERMTIQNHRKNGRKETKEVKLGDTLSIFEKVARQKRTELEGLLHELRDVDAEITTAKADIL